MTYREAVKFLLLEYRWEDVRTQGTLLGRDMYTNPYTACEKDLIFSIQEKAHVEYGAHFIADVMEQQYVEMVLDILDEKYKDILRDETIDKILN